MSNWYKTPAHARRVQDNLLFSSWIERLTPGLRRFGYIFTSTLQLIGTDFSQDNLILEYSIN
jgi:hypothetical protein